MLKVCAITSSRADWGLLSPLLSLIKTDPAFHLQIIVTGQHLDPHSGHTAQAIIMEGFQIDARVDMALGDDSAIGVTRSLALGTSGVGEALSKLAPDLVLVLGDRYEILGAVLSASLARIPVAHLCGGDVTEGAMDDAFRHAITKLSHLHFVTTPDAQSRVRQLGENPEHIYMVGSTGLDPIRSYLLLDRDAFFKSVGLKPRSKNIMVTFHPETLDPDTGQHCQAMLSALDQLGPDVGLLFSGTNSDVQGAELGRVIERFVATHSNAVLHASLGSQRYFSALKHMDAVVGNSSSGLYEAPSFHIPTVNIGDRQKGRLRATSVVDVAPDKNAIHDAVMKALQTKLKDVSNPYGDGHASERIVEILRTIENPQRLLKKKFMDMLTQ